MILRGGYVVTESGVEKLDVEIVDGIIKRIGRDLDGEGVELGGKYIVPGFVDLHTHLREPGLEHKEDLVSGSKAAVRGGYTRVCCMPNTSPVCDNGAIAGYIKRKADDIGIVKVSPIGACTMGERGENLAEFGKMKLEGIVAVSDDGRPVKNSKMLRNVMEYASDFDLPVLCHCEDLDLVDGGSVNEGLHSTLTGLRGIPALAEELDVARVILMAESLGKAVHICHVSTKGSVRIIRDAKARGVKVTAETCPHYIAANDSIIMSLDTNAKVNPPIRDESDRLALIEALKDGTIDLIATDHAPHHVDDKKVEFQNAAFGISGIETAFSLTYTALAEAGMGIEDVVRLMSTVPCQVLGFEGGVIREGAPADVTVVDLDSEYVIDSKDFLSKGKNTPFNGRTVKGKVVTTIVDGEVKYDNGRIVC